MVLNDKNSLLNSVTMLFHCIFRSSINYEWLLRSIISDLNVELFISLLVINKGFDIFT